MFLIKSDDCKKNISVKQLMDIIYLCILGLYVTRKLLETTTFELSWPKMYYEYLRVAMCIFLVIKIIVYDNKNIKAFLFDILYLILFYFMYRGTEYKFLLELGFFVLAAKEISYQKIIKCYCLVIASIMTITILGAMTGCIQDLVYLRDDVFKHAFGIGYTTDFGAHILFLAMTYLALRKKEPDIFLNIFLLLLAYILYKYSGARNNSGCIILLVLGGLYIKYSEKIILNTTKMKTRWNKIQLKVIRFVDIGLILSILIFALMALLLTICYTSDNIILSKLNQLSSGRLELGKSAIEKYGFSLWGTPFKMIGVRAGAFTASEYNFVDSSYVMIYIRYGAVLFVLTILGFLWLAIKAKKVGRRYMLILLTVMALQSVIEHHLIDISYNPFMLLIFSNFNSVDDSIYREEKQRGNIKVIKYAAGIIIAFAIYINYSRIFSYSRTLVTLLNLNKSEKHIYFILIILAVGIVSILTIGMLWNFCLAVLQKNKKLAFIFSFGNIICIIVLIVGAFTCNTIISNGSIKYKQTIQTGNIILEQLNQIKDLKIYIDDIPYLYAENEDIVNNIIPGTPYDRDTQGVVVITRASNEMTHLLNTGYMCGPISDTEYLYTNDGTVSKIVRENGIKMDNYYAAKQSVDLEQMAEYNKLSLDENLSLIIDGSENSMTKGPRITVYAGIYKVVYDLEIIDTEVSDGEVAKLKIASQKGENILKEIAVDRADFNENGHYVVSVESYIPDASNVEFLLLANGNTKLKLNSLTYQKIGKN